MESIFEIPLLLNGEEDNLVLVYSKYIIGSVRKEIVDLSIEGISKDVLNTSRFDSIIKIKEIFAYKFKPGKDSHITFGVKNVTGISYKKIGFKDPETTKQAEIELREQFEKLGFKRKEKKLSRQKAAILPLLLMIAIIGVFGGECTLCSYAQVMGYFPFLVIIIMLLILGVFWLFKRILKPPYQISASR